MAKQIHAPSAKAEPISTRGVGEFIQIRYDAEPADDHNLIGERRVITSTRASAIKIDESERCRCAVSPAKLFMRASEFLHSHFEIASPGTAACESPDGDNRRAAEPNRRIQNRFWAGWIDHATLRRCMRAPGDELP